MLENPPNDPYWLIVLTQSLDERGASAQIRPADQLWRDEWAYTPYEAIEALDGWVRSPARKRLFLENWQSLVADVTTGLQPLVSLF